MRAGAAAVCVALIATGCGSRAGTLEELWKRHGENVGLILGTSDYAPGSLRVSFVVVRRNGSPVYRPRARVWLARSRTSAPFERASAALEPVGVPGATGDSGDVTHVYVAHVHAPRPGRFWLLAAPVGGTPVRALAVLDVGRRAATPAVGAHAPASRTPTLASTHGDTALLTTRVPPDRALLRYSVADTLRAHVPFVVVFATPRFCTSRTCGPVVDVVDSVRRRFPSRGIRFIHVEIYRKNRPSLGPNRFVRQWRLPSEPWTFLIGRDGRIKAKFEGSLSIGELSAAVRRTLFRRGPRSRVTMSRTAHARHGSRWHG